MMNEVCQNITLLLYSVTLYPPIFLKSLNCGSEHSFKDFPRQYIECFGSSAVNLTIIWHYFYSNNEGEGITVLFKIRKQNAVEVSHYNLAPPKGIAKIVIVLILDEEQ